MIKFALLSDLHIRTENYDDQNKVLENIIEFFDELITKGDWINFVLVSGDITFSGKQEEFEIALNFFQRLRASLDIPVSNFIFTPGNHDYNGKDIGEGFKYIDSLDLARFEKIIKSPDFTTHINNAFKNYDKFLKLFKRSVPQISGHSSEFSYDNLKIHFLVINSALASTIGKGESLFVDTNLIKSMAPIKNEKNLCIFMMHHPLSILNIKNRRQLEEILVNSCDILISGHEHMPDYGTRGRLEGEEYICIGNGSTYLGIEYSPEKYLNRFSIIEYNPSVASIIINPWFTHSNMSFCGRDTSLYPKAKNDGIIRLKLNNKVCEDIDEIINDPLERFDIPKYLYDFFEENFDNIHKIDNKNSFFKLRRKIKQSGSLNFNRFALLFLKYLISEDLIKDYSDLYSLLKKVFIFSKIQRFHDRIKEYYNKKYFEEKRESIKKKISKRYKRKDIDKLEMELRLKEEKLEGLKDISTSIIELYKGRPIELLPNLPNVEVEDYSVHLDWYKKLGLVSDPFPSNDGLENIKEELFEKIIYPTPTIEEFKKILISDNINDLLNKTIAIYGAFGSGKTTLFQYMELLIKIHHNEIIFISIPLEARASLDEIRRNFYIKLNSKLKKIHLKELDYIISEVEIEEDCVRMLKNLSEKKKILFILIEDIYKHSGRKEYVNEVIGFIKALQIYRRDFSDRAITTSFFFSLIEEFIEKIRGDHSISGSVDIFHKMASINLDTALAMINKRLEVFAENHRNPPQVTRDFLARLKTIAIQSGTSIKTFRDYIEILLKRFRRLEFTQDAITIQFDDQAILTLLKDIESKHKNIHQSFLKLKERSKNKRATFEKFIIILEDLWRTDLLKELDFRYFKNKSYLIHLFDLKLLKKVTLQTRSAWTIDDACKKYFDKINNQYGLYPSSIIPSMYLTEEIPKILENKHIIALENIIKRSEDYGIEFIDLLKDITKNYKILDQFSKSLQIVHQKGISESKIKMIKESFSKLILAFVIQCDKDVDNYEIALELYEKSWYEIPEVTTFAKRLKEFDNLTLPTNEEKLNLLRDFLSVIKNIISTLKRFVQWDTLFSLKPLSIWNEDKGQLNNIRRNIESNNFELAKEKINQIIQKKLELFIYDFTRILYGETKWKRGIPEDINLKIKHILNYIQTSQTIAEKGLLSRLNLNDLFDIINFLSTIKTKNMIEFLSKINLLCKKIRSNLKKKNPWSFDICNFIEKVDNFYELLSTGEFPTPWNSHIYKSFEDIKDRSYLEHENLDELNIEFPLIFDKDLRPMKFNVIEFNFIQFIYWINHNKENLKISFDYRKELITIDKKG